MLAGLAVSHTGERDAVVKFDGLWLEMGDTDGTWSVRPIGWKAGGVDLAQST